ncbi:hypothetical protein [uncultured Shimia sp.]|uniref:hypothetical protein n=1 Tax=uncultured Shimia sp. TaxID=573152 RepID=UPI00263549EE|nr:hypothetical protein [uncultured Shimia sp.]
MIGRQYRQRAFGAVHAIRDESKVTDACFRICGIFPLQARQGPERERKYFLPHFLAARETLRIPLYMLKNRNDFMNVNMSCAS